MPRAVFPLLLWSLSASAGPLVVIDPGHGGSADGATSPSGWKEKTLALEVSLRVKEALEKTVKAKVRLTREKDAPLNLNERVKWANDQKPDLFLSIHANSMPTRALRLKTSGIERYFLSAAGSSQQAKNVAARENAEIPGAAKGPGGDTLSFILADMQRSETHADSSRLAYSVHEKLIGATGAPDRGVQQAPGTAEAKAVGNKDHRGINDLTTIPGIAAGDDLRLSLTDKDGNAVAIGAYGTAGATSVEINISAGMSTDELITAINDIRIDEDGVGGTAAQAAQAFEAKLDDKGQLQIRSLNGGNFKMVFEGTGLGAGDGYSDAADLAMANSLGFGKLARVTGNQEDNTLANTNTTSVEFTAIADVALRSFNFVKNTNGDVADRSTLLSDVRNGDAAGNPLLFAGLNDDTDTFTIAVNGGSTQSIQIGRTSSTSGVSIQDFVDSINNNTTLNTKIQASFDEKNRPDLRQSTGCIRL